MKVKDLKKDKSEIQLSTKLSPGIRSANMFLFIFALLSKGLVDAFIIKDNPNGPLNLVKYAVLAVGILVYSYELYIRRSRHFKLIFVKEFHTLMLMVSGVIFLSIFYIVKNGNYTSRTLKELIYLTIPIVFAYLALNIFEVSDFVRLAKVALVIFGVCYVFEIGYSHFTPSQMLESMLNISFAGGNTIASNSVFESSAFSDTFMALLFFFGYYRKGNSWWFWLSAFLVILANKRLMILFAFFIIVVTYLPKSDRLKRKQLRSWSWILPAILFAFMPLLAKYSTTISAEFMAQQKFGINLPDFWMGRDVMVRNFVDSNFTSLGLGSTFSFQGSLLEIEGIKFLLELGIIGVVLISFSYWKITRGNVYCLLLMSYSFMNINTSTSIMTGTFSWIFYLIVIGCCLYHPDYELISTDATQD